MVQELLTASSGVLKMHCLSHSSVIAVVPYVQELIAC